MILHCVKTWYSLVFCLIVFLMLLPSCRNTTRLINSWSAEDSCSLRFNFTKCAADVWLMTSSLCLKEQIKEQFNFLWQTLFIHDKKQFPQHESANNKTANKVFYIWLFVQIQGPVKRFRSIYWQKWCMMFKMSLSVCNHLKCYLRMSLRHVAPEHWVLDADVSRCLM